MKIRDVPFVALGGVIEKDDIDAVMGVLEGAMREGGNLFPLPEENNFQNAFAIHEGAAKAVAVNSAGTALDVCMQVLNIKPGDEVITTPLTFVCTAGCAAARGARVVFADIDPVTMNLDPEKAEAKITEKTRAIIPVHMAGLAVDIDAFDALSAKHSIPIVYDAAHAVGARHHGQPIGGRGRAACYSFQSNKNMTCMGEGGMITTNDPEFAERARQKKTFGYVYGGPGLKVVTIGFNYRMTKPQYAIGLTQLAKIDRLIARRLERFKQMQERLKSVQEIITPAGIEEGHGCHLYIARLDTDKTSFGREEFTNHLKREYKVAVGWHYPAVWSWEALAEVDYERSDCDQAEKACSQVMSLPVFPGTSSETVDYVAWAIKQTIHDLKK